MSRVRVPITFLLAGAIYAAGPVGKGYTQPLLLNEPSLDFSVNEVKRLRQDGGLQPAVPGAVLKGGEALTTGPRSRADLNFGKVQVRVGSRSQISLEQARQFLDLREGTYLVAVPDDAGEVSLKTPTISLTVRNSVFVLQQKSGVAKVFSLTDRSNGVLTVLRPDGRALGSLKGGQLLEVEAQQTRLSRYDVGEFFRTSSLFNGLRPGEGTTQSSLALRQVANAQLIPSVQAQLSTQESSTQVATAGQAQASNAVATATTAGFVADPSASFVVENSNFLNNLVRTPEATRGFTDRLNLGAASARSDINDALSNIGSINLPGNATVDAVNRLNNSLNIINSAPVYNDQVKSQVLSCLQGFTCE